ncbi:nucleoside transporter C-terminal domain-containing protein [Enterocloster clostridioformis]|uniref:NupC family nucleoside transporter n=1 Tax=[Clostridium] clostridioforme 90A8 TaxID=999408 RepID=A0A0E2H7L0_9FIRM|nr:NupC family nucleoside transporter [[Clostridium] clostridioforme 90A8]
MVLAIMYLISWKKKNISVKMLVKAVIAQFLNAVILVKVPAGRYVVPKVSDAVTSVINCGQDGLSFVFGSLADSTAAAGSVFAIQVLGNIVFLSALVSFLYYIGILGFVVKWIGKAVGKLMGTSEVESFVAVANMFLGQTDSPMPVAMVALVAAVNKLLGVCGISLQQVFSYVFAPFGFFLGLDPSEILLEGNLLGSKLVLNEFVAFQQLGGMISSMDYRTGMIFAISLCGFANFSSLGICVSGIAVLCPEKKSTLARLVFKAMLGGVAVSLISAMTVGLVTLC